MFYEFKFKTRKHFFTEEKIFKHSKRGFKKNKIGKHCITGVLLEIVQVVVTILLKYRVV